MRAPDAVTRWRDSGWVRLPAEPRTRAWADHAHRAARDAVADPANAHWLRCGGTWFVGANVLPNDGAGRLPGGPALAGPAIDILQALGLAGIPFDRGQVSVVHPGYPRRDPGESETAFRFRSDRDAAHVDGLLAIGPDRRRMARERHAFILGLPLNDADPGASPLVVWDGSHRIVANAFRAALDPVAPEAWGDVDLTDVYTAARREVFETCPRVAVHVRPGEACLLHPMLLHGVAPWSSGARAPAEGRMIAYFRPMVDCGRWGDNLRV